MRTLVFLFLAMIGVCKSQLTQKIVEEPEDVRVLLGSTAVLKCRVENQVGPVQWTKNGFGLGDDRALPKWNRYSMIGSSSSGEYTLEIKEVELSDDAQFQCQLGRALDQPSMLSRKVRLTVLVTPEAPVFVNIQDLISATEGREFSVECLSAGGKPAPSIEWVIASSSDGKNPVKTFSANKFRTDVKEDGQLFNVRSSLRFQPTKSENGKYLACIANHETVGKVAAVTGLSVDYAPKVAVALNNSGEVLREHESATLNCIVDAKPNNNLRYVWKKDGNTMLSKFQKSFVISPLGREHHGSTFTCEASNSVGTGHGKLKLEVESEGVQFDYNFQIQPISGSEVENFDQSESYNGPMISSFPQNVNVDVGGTVTLQCKADSHPPARILWTKLGNPGTVLGEGANFTISNLHEAQKGSYRCEASVKGFRSASIVSTVRINGPPTVIMPKIVRAPLNSDVDLTCEVRGFPEPSSVTWMKNGAPLNETHQRDFERRQFSPGPGQYISILKIRDIEEDDFGPYTCTARNKIDFDSAMTHLKAKSLISLYVLLPIMIGGLVLIVCLIIFCVFCYRRQLCSSKTTTHSGDGHSDVTVKLEEVDGRPTMGYDMYSPISAVPENGDITYGKDYYHSVPQDNPDLDLLPPPYSSYIQTTPGSNYSFYNNTPSTFHPPASRAEYYVEGAPITSHQQILYAYSDQYGNLVEAAVPQPDYTDGYGTIVNDNQARLYPGGQDPYGTYSNGNIRGDYGNGNEDMYYPSQNGMAPLATLEPVQELPTPEERSYSTFGSDHQRNYNNKPSTFKQTSPVSTFSARQPSPPGSEKRRSPTAVTTTASLHNQPPADSAPLISSTPSTNV